MPGIHSPMHTGCSL